MSKTHSLLRITVLVIACACKSEDTLTSEQKQKLVERYTETAQEYLRMGELDRAEGQTMKALAIEPHNLKCKMIRGWTLQKRGKTDDILTAERIFREILDQGDYRAGLGLAECLERKGVLFEESSADLLSGKRVSASADPSDPGGPAARSRQALLERDRAWTESIQRYEGVLKDHPDDVDALNGAMRMSALLGRLDASVSYADKLIAVIGPTRTFWQQKIFGKDATVESERLYRERVEHLLDLEVATRVHSATLLHKLGRDEDALSNLDAAIALDTRRPELYSRRAEIQKQLGHPDKAIVDIDQFLHRSTQTYDHPDVRRAWRLRRECEDQVRTAPANAPGPSR